MADCLCPITATILAVLAFPVCASAAINLRVNETSDSSAVSSDHTHDEIAMLQLPLWNMVVTTDRIDTELPTSSLQEPHRMRAGGFIEEGIHQNALAEDSRLAEHDKIDLAFLSLKDRVASHVKKFGAVQAIAIYVGCLTLGGLVVTLIYWSLGASVIAKILVYLAGGCLITLSVKEVFHDNFNFHFPKLLSAFHMLATTAVGFAILLHRKRFQGSSIRIPSFSDFAFNFLPLCLGITYSLGCANSALIFCSVAFFEIISASTPFFSILLMTCLGMSFNWYLLWPLSGIVFGCMGTVMGTVDFSSHGLLLILLANLGRASKAVFQQCLMTGEVNKQYDPATLLFWQSLICSPMMLAWSALAEGAPAYAALFQQAQPGLFFGIIAMSCVIAAAFNGFHMLVVKDFGAVGVQATAQLKQSLVVLGGVVLFGEKVTLTNVGCGAIVMVSSFWYSRLASKSKDEKK